MNWEWGCVLKNDSGALFHEIGEINQHPLRGRTCKDAQKYGKYWNRLATLEKEECPATRCSGNMTGAKLADYVFGECSMRQCPPPPCECAHNTWYSDFDCVAQCPAGRGGTGNTLSTRKCVDCSACLNDVFTACDDGKLFHDGTCVDTCPRHRLGHVRRVRQSKAVRAQRFVRLQLSARIRSADGDERHVLRVFCVLQPLRR